MYAEVKSEGLNVHSAPDGPVTDTLKHGDRVLVRTSQPTGTEHVKWWPILAIGLGRHVYGWVDGRFLHFIEVPESAPPPPPPVPDYEPVFPPARERLGVPLWCWVALGITIVLAILLTFARADDRPHWLPDPVLTPGQVTALTTDEICARKWGKDTRYVSRGMKTEVFARYGLTGHTHEYCIQDAHGRRCEIDHLVPREIGGADVILNLWPQPYGGHPWNAVRKDRLENRLHREVCAGNIPLEKAQRDIAVDWTAVYLRYFGEP